MADTDIFSNQAQLTAPGAHPRCSPSSQPQGQGAVLSLPPSARTAHPPTGCPGASTSPPRAASRKWEQKEAGGLQEQSEAADRELSALRPRAAPRAALRGARPDGLPAARMSRASGLRQTHDWPQDRRLRVPHSAGPVLLTLTADPTPPGSGMYRPCQQTQKPLPLCWTITKPFQKSR